MKRIIKQISSSPFFTSSLIMLLGTNFTNALNYLYHMMMGKILGPAGYGELASLISFIVLLCIAPQSLSLVIIKFVSSSSSVAQTKSLNFWLSRKIYILSFVALLTILLTANLISVFLKINNPYHIALLGLLMFFYLPTFYYRSLLQGLLKFSPYVSTLLIETSVKLILGILLVLMGFKVTGAVVGLLFSVMIGWLVAKLYLDKSLDKETFIYKKPKLNSMFIYSLPVMLQAVAMTSFYSSDLLLVKHFFNPHEAGIYAAVSTLGRVIFFALTPISVVLFPIVSKKHSKGEKHQRIFWMGLMLATLGAAFILAIYYFLPNFSINLLFGKDYIQASSLLFSFSFFISLLTISYLIINYYLSINKIKVTFIPLFAAIAQVIGIWFFHNSLQNVIFVSIYAALALLASLFVYHLLQVKIGLQKD